MKFQPILTADPVIIVVHIICGVTALIVGPIALCSKRRGALHRAIGYLRVFSMPLLTGTSFFIEGLAVFGGFGPIHLLSLFAIWSVFGAMRQIYLGNSALHRRIMHNLYWYGLVIVGLVNFLPGRVTNRVFLGTLR
jgi:uncharacterized membrane protein